MEILEKIKNSLRIKDEGVILHFLENELKNSTNKKHLIILNKIKREMEKPYADKTPLELWLELGMGRFNCPYTLPIWIYYYKYYEDVISELSFSEIRFLNPTELLHFDFDMSDKSNFHNHTAKLKNILSVRKERIERIEVWQKQL